MGAHAPLHGQVAGYRRVEATGNQRQHRVDAPDGVPPQAAVPVSNHKQGFLADFKIDRHFRVFQPNSRGCGPGQQGTSHHAFHVNRGELVLAAALAANGEVSALELLLIDRQYVLDNILQVRQRVLHYLQDVGDTGGVAHALYHSRK